MKTIKFPISASIAFFAATLFAEPIEINPEEHSVTLEVVSNDPGIAAPIEFFLAGPGSDHDYESLFLTVAPVDEIAKAFEKAQIPRGKDIDYRACRFWPTGVKLVVEPDLWSLVKDTRNGPMEEAVFTGGKRDASLRPIAADESPNAVFALYDCPQSLISLDNSLPQSDTYGRFTPAIVIPEGEKRKIKFTWKGESAPREVNIKIEPGKMGEAIIALKEKATTGAIDVTSDFDGELTIAEAAEIASAFAVIDSLRVKINGYKQGQFYYRAFLPLEKWRDRTERLTQPYEIRLSENAKPILTVIDEDWSDVTKEDPKLIVKENVTFDSIGKEGDKTDTCLFFAPKTMKLKELYSILPRIPKNIVNFYIYGE